MKLIIDIPAEFETDYNGDKFKDFFSRVLYSIEKVDGLYGLCGNYEKETAEMFLKAFDESVQADDIELVRKKAVDDFIHTYLKWYEERYDRFADDERIEMLKLAEKFK